MIFWPRETAILLKLNLRYFHREKSTFEKFDAGLKLRIVFYTHKTIKNRRKNIRVIYTLINNVIHLKFMANSEFIARYHLSCSALIFCFKDHEIK